MRKAKWQRIEKLVSKLVGATPVHELDKKGIDAVTYNRGYQVKYTETDKICFNELVRYRPDIDIIICFGSKTNNRYKYTVYSLRKIPFRPSALFGTYIKRDAFCSYGTPFYIYYQPQKVCFEVKLLAYEEDLK